MSYTAPTTRTTGTLITASIWNTDLVDNISYLKSERDTADSSLSTGWKGVSGSWSYASASTIIVPSGAASLYNKGYKFKLTANSVVLQGYIVGVADTLLTVAGDALTNHAFSSVYYSKTENPLDFPDCFDWPSAPVGWGGSPPTTVARFKIKGKVCSGDIFQTNTGTSTTTTVSFTLPVAAKTVTNHEWVSPIPWCWDNGAAQSNGQTRIATAGTSINCYKSGGAAWTGSGGKAVGFHFEYEI